MATCPGIVVLVIVLSLPECTCERDLRHHIRSALAQLFDESESRVTLGFVEIKNGGAVLRAHIRALPVSLTGIVCLKKKLDEVLETDASGIEYDFDRFRVPRPSATYLPVGRIGDMTTAVTDACGQNALLLHEMKIRSPETSRGEQGAFGARLKRKGNRIHAVPRVAWREPLPGEYVPEMPLAARADDFGSAAVHVGYALDGTVDFGIKAGPPASGIEFVVRPVEGCAALPAHVGSILHVMAKDARKRWLRSLVQDDMCFFGRQCIFFHSSRIAR